MDGLRALLWLSAAGVLAGLGCIGAGVVRKRRELATTGLLAAILSCLVFLLAGWLILGHVGG